MWMTLWSQASLEQQQWWVWRQVHQVLVEVVKLGFVVSVLQESSSWSLRAVSADIEVQDRQIHMIKKATPTVGEERKSGKLDTVMRICHSELFRLPLQLMWDTFTFSDSWTGDWRACLAHQGPVVTGCKEDTFSKNLSIQMYDDQPLFPNYRQWHSKFLMFPWPTLPTVRTIFIYFPRWFATQAEGTNWNLRRSASESNRPQLNENSRKQNLVIHDLPLIAVPGSGSSWPYNHVFFPDVRRAVTL